MTGGWLSLATDITCIVYEAPDDVIAASVAMVVRPQVK